MKHCLFTLFGALVILMTSCCKSSTPVYHETDEVFRSVYHHTPQANWMNDPNGMFFDETTGLWHLYFQYYPDGTVWGPMHWGHSTSKDLIHWDYQPIAIYPDANGMIFSGSCVIDRHNTAGFGENAIIAIYTSADKAQHQSISYSTDGGTTFTAYEGNPVILGDIPDFRDPKVFWDEQSNQWTMALACQQEIRFYQSKDLKNWQLTSRFGAEYGCHDGVWECPDLIKLKCENGKCKNGKCENGKCKNGKCENEKIDRWVLIVNINPGGPFGGSATQYFVGDWDGKEFKCENGKCENEKMVKWLDYGKDHYATVTWHNAPDNRCVAIGWMSNWQYATVLPTVAFRSQNTIARDLSLYTDDAGELRVRVVPSPESMALKGEPTDVLGDAAVVELELNGEQDAVITLSNDKGEKVIMTLDVHRQTFSMDRTASGDCSFSHDFSAVTTAPLFKCSNEEKSKCKNVKIVLFLDHCSIEAFDGDGAWAMTNLVFPSEPYNHLEVIGGKATIYDIKN